MPDGSGKIGFFLAAGSRFPLAGRKKSAIVRAMDVLPTPPVLIRQFERGLLTREELHEKMAIHARALIEEMEEEHANPLGSLVERWRNRHHASRLIAKHGERRVREVFHALSELEDFFPAGLLWNASHFHVPLHCFIRMQRAPLFRVKKMSSTPSSVTLEIEYSQHSNDLRHRETFHLVRNRRWLLEVVKRSNQDSIG